jgi:hypothetical protein
MNFTIAGHDIKTDFFGLLLTCPVHLRMTIHGHCHAMNFPWWGGGWWELMKFSTNFRYFFPFPILQIIFLIHTPPPPTPPHPRLRSTFNELKLPWMQRDQSPFLLTGKGGRKTQTTRVHLAYANITFAGRCPTYLTCWRAIALNVLRFILFS